ncbi:MAG: transcriptional regulator [Alphaproteobacteria bacterium]|nr:MAG: transcriptional regulator [Alphaproteobacteria bacterium]
MVDNISHRLDATFHALADPTRRGMLATLALGDRTVGALAEPYAMSLAAASKHIKTLERAGLVRREVSGRTHICRLEAKAMADAFAWMDYYRKFWTDRLDALEAVLMAEDAAKDKGL